jgi:hypothetical protein
LVSFSVLFCSNQNNNIYLFIYLLLESRKKHKKHKKSSKSKKHKKSKHKKKDSSSSESEKESETETEREKKAEDAEGDKSEVQPGAEAEGNAEEFKKMWVEKVVDDAVDKMIGPVPLPKVEVGSTGEKEYVALNCLLFLDIITS